MLIGILFILVVWFILYCMLVVAKRADLFSDENDNFDKNIQL